MTIDFSNHPEYQKALRMYNRQLHDIAVAYTEERDDSMQKFNSHMLDFMHFWTRTQIDESAFNWHITWRDLWMAFQRWVKL